MILAHPDSDLQKNLMVVSADIVRMLSTKGRSGKFVFIEDLLEEFLMVSPKRTPEMFLNSLTLLYSVGVLEKKEYRIKLVPQKQMIKQESLF